MASLAQVGALPLEGTRNPFVYPPYEFFSACYNQVCRCNRSLGCTHRALWRRTTHALAHPCNPSRHFIPYRPSRYLTLSSRTAAACRRPFSSTNRQIVPAFGIPRRLDGLVCYDSAVARIDHSVFTHTLDGAVGLRASARALVTNSSFSNAGVALEACDEAEAALDGCLVSGCANGIFAQGTTKVLAEGNTVSCAKLGAAMHGACTVAMHGNRFSACRDGVLYSGGDPLYQTVEFCNNSVLCTPPKVTRVGGRAHAHIHLHTHILGGFRMSSIGITGWRVAGRSNLTQVQLKAVVNKHSEHAAAQLYTPLSYIPRLLRARLSAAPPLPPSSLFRVFCLHRSPFRFYACACTPINRTRTQATRG